MEILARSCPKKPAAQNPNHSHMTGRHSGCPRRRGPWWRPQAPALSSGRGRGQPCVRCTHLQSQAAPAAPNLRLPLSGAAHQVPVGAGLELEGPHSPSTDAETEASAGCIARPGQGAYLTLCHTPSQSFLVGVRAKAVARAGMLGSFLAGAPDGHSREHPEQSRKGGLLGGC